MGRFSETINIVWLALKRNNVCKDIRLKICHSLKPLLFVWETERLIEERISVGAPRYKHPWPEISGHVRSIVSRWPVGVYVPERYHLKRVKRTARGDIMVWKWCYLDFANNWRYNWFGPVNY